MADPSVLKPNPQDTASTGHSSPYSLTGRNQANTDRPGLVDTSDTGTSWSGIMHGATILDMGGETYGDTTIDLSNADNRARIDRAKEAIPDDVTAIYATAQDLGKFFDNFSARIHKPDVVGSYFPKVLELQAEQSQRLGLAQQSVLAGVLSQIKDLRESRSLQNSADWSKRSSSGSVTNEAVKSIEGRNWTTELAILQIEREAAYEVLGQDAANEIESHARSNLGDFLNELDLERHVGASLMRAAAEARMPEIDAQLRAEAEANGTGETFRTYNQLVQDERDAWDQKHNSQSDFSHAMRDGNPDCSEYASLSAVSLEESGIPNLRVMGHTMSDSDYPIVGAHAYNVILDETGQNIVGVFEGTALAGSFRPVMNDVSLAEFEAGATLVTFSDESGWNTYGTGSPANGRDLLDYDHERDELVCNLIEHQDLALIQEQKMEHLHELRPAVIADRIIDLYEQYGTEDTSPYASDNIRVQGWLDGIRDDGNPAFAQAAQLLQDYRGEMPPPESLRQQIIDIVDRAQDRGLATNNYDLAITEDDLFELERPASASLAEDLKPVLDQLRDAQPSTLATLNEQNPWLPEAMALMDGKVSYGESFHKAYDENDRSHLDAYARLSDIVRDNDISLEDVEDLTDTAKHVAPNVEKGLAMGASFNTPSIG